MGSEMCIRDSHGILPWSIYLVNLESVARLKSCYNFYCTVVRPSLEYCSPIFHRALPEYLIDDIEQVQKRALSIISRDCSYSLCLSIYDLDTLRSQLEEQCFKLFNVIPGNHKLSLLLPPKNVNHYNLRRNRTTVCKYSFD